MEKRRFALIGTGNRGTTMWGKDLLAGWREHVDLTAICREEFAARRARPQHDRQQCAALRKHRFDAC